LIVDRAADDHGVVADDSWRLASGEAVDQQAIFTEPFGDVFGDLARRAVPAGMGDEDPPG
jgi:hypothetical protein